MTPGYILCTMPRSGSTLVCTLLTATGRAGEPDSFFHDALIMREWAAAWGLADTDATAAGYERLYLDAAIAAGRGGTGRFAMRLQHDHLGALMRTLARLFPDPSTDSDRLERAFGPLRYVHLTRRDRIAQAVSLVTARQTGLWHRNRDGSERERTAPPAQAVYDRSAITAAIDHAVAADRDWRRWFDAQGIDPLTLDYATVASEPAAAIRNLCVALDIDLTGIDVPEPLTARLADAVTRAWIDRYREETMADDR